MTRPLQQRRRRPGAGAVALDTPGVNVVLVGIDNERELGCAIDALGRSPLAAGKLDKLAEFDCSSEDWVHPERWQVGK